MKICASDLHPQNIYLSHHRLISSKDEDFESVVYFKQKSG